MVGGSTANNEVTFFERCSREPIRAWYLEGGTSGKELVVSDCAERATSFCGWRRTRRQHHEGLRHSKTRAARLGDEGRGLSRLVGPGEAAWTEWELWAMRSAPPCPMSCRLAAAIWRPWRGPRGAAGAGPEDGWSGVQSGEKREAL